MNRREGLDISLPSCDRKQLARRPAWTATPPTGSRAGDEHKRTRMSRLPLKRRACAYNSLYHESSNFAPGPLTLVYSVHCRCTCLDHPSPHKRLFEASSSAKIKGQSGFAVGGPHTLCSSAAMPTRAGMKGQGDRHWDVVNMGEGN
jgi:hypothetical protein